MPWKRRRAAKRPTLATDSAKAVGTWRRLSEGGIEGELVWAHDPLFRPTVGLFLNGLLVAGASTRRTRPVSGAGWTCIFRVDGPSHVATGLEVLCLESGESLDGPRELVATPTVVEVCRAASRAPEDLSGFPAFLRLPVSDQIRLLYLDYMGRPADDDGLTYYERSVVSGQQDILGVRDQLVASREFMDRALTRADRAGRWLVWRGLHALPSIGDDDGWLTAGQDIDPPASERADLGRLALGPGSDPRDLEAWLADTRLVDNLKPRHEAPRCRRMARVQDLWGLASAMRAAEAGLAVDNHVRSNADQDGVFAHGPYVRLTAGTYLLCARLQIVALGGPARVAVEIVHHERIVGTAQMFLHEGAAGPIHIEAPFYAPEASETAPGWEFRFGKYGPVELDLEEIILRAAMSVEQKFPSIPLEPVLTCNSAARRTAEAIETCGPNHVIYGPYRRLFAGQYELSLDAVGAGRLTCEIVEDGQIVWQAGAEICERGLKLRTSFTARPDGGIFEYRVSLDESHEVRILNFALTPLRFHLGAEATSQTLI